jgi:hypothetical protein
MPFWRKCILSPDTTVPCLNCNKKVSVPWVAVIAAVPIALGIVAAVSLSGPTSYAGLLAGFVAYFALQRYAVPVIPRDQ